MLVDVCVEAEAAVWHHQTFSYLNAHTKPPIDPTHSIAIATVEASLKASASVILLATTSGRSAQLVARYRPRCPIIAITRYGQVARQLNTWRAIIPLHYVDPPLPEWTRELDVRFQYAIEFAKDKGIVCPGDVMVLLNGWRQGAGFTNTIRVVYASESFPWVYPHKLPDYFPLDEEISEREESRSWGSISKTGTGNGEPAATDVDENQSQQHSSLGSAIKSLKDQFKTVAETKSKEVSDKLLASIHTMKSNQRTILPSTQTNIEYKSLHTTTQSGPSHKTATRTNTELTRSERLSDRARTLDFEKTATRTNTDLPTSSRLSNQHGTVVYQNTGSRTNTEVARSTRLSNQHGNVVSQRTATRTNTELTKSIRLSNHGTVVSQNTATRTNTEIRISSTRGSKGDSVVEPSSDKVLPQD